MVHRVFRQQDRTYHNFRTDHRIPHPDLVERSGWDRRRPDGALWFVELSGNKIGRITIDGIITESVIPTSAGTRIAIER